MVLRLVLSMRRLRQQRRHSATYLFDLVTVGDDVTLGVDSGIDDGLTATGAGRFDFLDGIGELHQSPGTLKQMGLEVGPQAVAHHVDANISLSISYRSLSG